MGCACAGNAGNVFPATRDSDPAGWCTCRDACRDRYPAVSVEVVGGENVPGIPGACANRNFMYLVRGPWGTSGYKWSLEATRFGFKFSQSLPRWLSNFRAIQAFKHLFSRLRDFTGSWRKTPNCFWARSTSIHQQPTHNRGIMLALFEIFFACSKSAVARWHHDIKTFSALLALCEKTSFHEGHIIETFSLLQAATTYRTID